MSAWVARTRSGAHAAAAFLMRLYATFVDANGLLHASAIAFFGILSILPFSLLAVGLVARVLRQMPESASGLIGADAILDRLRHAIPLMDDRLGELLSALAARPMPLSVLSSLTLAYAASAGFDAASAGVNSALGTERQRRFFTTKLLVAGLVIMSIGGLLLWSMVTNLLNALAERLDVSLPRWLFGGSVLQLLVELGTLAIGHSVLVRFMATERRAPKHRWVGSIAFAVCFTVARWVLGLYLSEVASYDRYYGVAGAFFGLSLWMYVVSILLIGSCVVIRVLAEPNPAPAERARTRSGNARR